MIWHPLVLEVLAVVVMFLILWLSVGKFWRAFNILIAVGFVVTSKHPWIWLIGLAALCAITWLLAMDDYGEEVNPIQRSQNSIASQKTIL